MRLQKYLAEAGVASRRQCESLILEQRVCVNGETAQIGRVIDPENDSVTLDGAPIMRALERVVLLFYKPRGVVCTSMDPEGRKTVQDFFQEFPQRLYNVGRLDINSEGLLIMTNDGRLTQYMTHPSHEVEKTYYVVCDGTLTSMQADLLTRGVMLDDGITAPARVAHIRPTKTGQTSFLISIREGRNRQIRRMVEAVGHKALRLKRESIGELKLMGLEPGAWRHATDTEMLYIDTCMFGNKEML